MFIDAYILSLTNFINSIEILQIGLFAFIKILNIHFLLKLYMYFFNEELNNILNHQSLNKFPRNILFSTNETCLKFQLIFSLLIF